MKNESNSATPTASFGFPSILYLFRVERPMVFICSPYAGCIKGNVQNARQYSRFAYLSGYMPITPHLMYPLFLNDKHANERLDGMDMGLRLLDLCEELWVFGDRYSTGMQREIAHAISRFMTIRYFDRDCIEVKRREK